MYKYIYIFIYICLYIYIYLYIYIDLILAGKLVKLSINMGEDLNRNRFLCSFSFDKSRRIYCNALCWTERTDVKYNFCFF